MNQIHLWPEWERQAPARQPALRRQLPEAIAAHFSGSELDDLLYCPQVNEVLGRTMAERARELVLYMDRHGRLCSHANTAVRRRPDPGL